MTLTVSRGLPRTIAGISVVVAGLAALQILAAHADSVETGQLVLLMKFRPGESLKYQSKMQMGIQLPPQFGGGAQAGAANPGSAGGTPITVNATQDIKVRRAGPAGGGDLDVTTTGQNSLPGQPSMIPNDPRPATMTYDPQGKLLSVKRQSETASSNPMFSAMLGQGLLSMQGLVLPAKPVKIGETWTQSVPIPGITGNQASTIKTTLVRIENIGKYRTARLHVVISTPVKAYLDAGLQPTEKASQAASTMTGTALVTDEVNFAVAEGMVVRSVSKGVTSMAVAIGRPTPSPTAPAKRKKGAAPTPPRASKPAQTLTITVKSDIQTDLVEPTKKG